MPEPEMCGIPSVPREDNQYWEPQQDEFTYDTTSTKAEFDSNIKSRINK